MRGCLCREGENDYFNPRSPRGEQLRFHLMSSFRLHFNPRSPRGERPYHRKLYYEALYFNPRSPWGERQVYVDFAERQKEFQSTLHVGGATLEALLTCIREQISIHAPRGGSDWDMGLLEWHLFISIHAPRGGSDFASHFYFSNGTDFNPRSPWGERRLM